ncbi:hypothetical protein [Paenibacillus sp. FJAT-26967]|uniref:hypothetical protein n=1 Tax=Paenibacillus sp. FJAT-26967 TaxID=1729690 RepID=UPI0008392D3B|nr:hypothetical protein [Paenibacillus sp. FJAT-26967]
MSHAIKKHVIFKKDKWNMITVEVNGSRLILREISDQWGEDTHTFMSRPALMKWANDRFPKDKYEGTEEEYNTLMEAFRSV